MYQSVKGEYCRVLTFTIQVSLYAEPRQILDVFGHDCDCEAFICFVLRIHGRCEVFGELLKIPALCCCLSVSTDVDIVNLGFP